jgi:hypothetical protein
MAETAARATQQAESVLGLAEQVSAAEVELVLATFAELKRRGDGEMRVATRRDRTSGIVEVTYCGVHEKADLDGLRQMYARLRTRGTTFGGTAPRDGGHRDGGGGG